MWINTYILYTRGFITTVIPILVSATPLYFGWLSLSARKYGKQFEWHYKSAPYILDSSVFLPGNMVSSLMALKKCPLYFGWHSLSARKYGKQFEWHYKSVPYILDGTVFLPKI